MRVCADPGLGLCFGGSLLAAEAGEIPVLVSPQNSPPIPSFVSGKGTALLAAPGVPQAPERALSLLISVAMYFYPNITHIVQLMTFFLLLQFFKPNNIFSPRNLCQQKGWEKERKAIGMNCFVGDVQASRGAIRKTHRFQNSVWGWTGGRCTMGTCSVLYKGTVTFSCVLKLLPEMEADFAEAEEPRASSASACSWGCYAAEGPRCGTG